MDNKTVILVNTCAKYKNIWEPFFYFFKKYWPDCPFKVYLGTDFLEDEFKIEGVDIIEGKVKNWGGNIRSIVNQIKEPTFILILDDFLLKEKIDTNRIIDYVNFMINNNIGCIRLWPSPWPNSACNLKSDLGILPIGQHFRMSLQTALWNKSTFLKLPMDGETIWEMEFAGTIRTYSLPEHFLSVLRDEGMFKYVMGARAGEWTDEAIKYCEDNGVKVKFSTGKMI